MKKNPFREWLKIAGLSFLLFILTCWTAGIHFALAAGVESVCFLVFTWYCLKKYKSEAMTTTMIVTAIIVGRFILETPLRINDFRGTLISISVPVICLASIFMGVLCFYKNKMYVWGICLALILAYSFLVPCEWFLYWRENFSDK